MAKRGLFGRIRDFFLGPKEEPKPVKKAQAPVVEKPKPKLTKEERTAAILNGALNPSGEELTKNAGKKNYRTTKARPHKIQIEYYNVGNDEPSWITGQQRKPYTTQDIIDLFQHHSEYGIEGSDEEPFNVNRARIWMSE